MAISLRTLPTLGTLRTICSASCFGGIGRHFAGQQDVAVVAGDIDMHRVLEFFVEAVGSLEFDALVLDIGAGGAAVVGHQRTCSDAGGNDGEAALQGWITDKASSNRIEIYAFIQLLVTNSRWHRTGSGW